MSRRDVILGGTGFIGKNLADRLLRDEGSDVAVFGNNPAYERYILESGASCTIDTFDEGSDFDSVLEGADTLYHLLSSTVPATSNRQIADELGDIGLSARILDACVRQGVDKVVFLSSGGAVYGSGAANPVSEDSPVEPISSYGYQKVAVEQLLALYRRVHGLDYRVVRLSNPFGPYQLPGRQGVVAMLLECALTGVTFPMRGDGSAVRDYIYIEDAADAITNIATQDTKHRTYNIGSGNGTSLADLVKLAEEVSGRKLAIEHIPAPPSDVDANWLDVSRYAAEFGNPSVMPMEEGMTRTLRFLESIK